MQIDKYFFDRLIVSSDDSCFLEFSPIISKAWRSLFPGLKLTLAYVTDRENVIQELYDLFDDIIVFKNIEGVPSANLAKIARRYACTQYGNEVCMIEDIDTAPLRSDYVINYAKQRRPGTIGMVGLEVYEGTPHYGKVPASNTHAESTVWKNVINPKNLEFPEWISTLKGIKIFDYVEDPYSQSTEFSDESLMRALIKINNVSCDSITYINRDCNPRHDWIDRSWWEVDSNRLQKNEYTMVNFKRPIGNEAELVVSHIFNSLITQGDRC